jgi:WD40 repeat protein
VAVTPRGRFAVSASADNAVRVWNLDTGKVVRRFEGHTNWVLGVAVTVDGRFAVSASEDRTLRIWKLGDPSVLDEGPYTEGAVRALEGHASAVLGVAVTPDGRFAVSVSRDNTLRVWDLGTGQLLTTLGAYAPLQCCAVTPDGTTILAGDASGALHILDWQNPPPPTQ